MSSTKKYQTLEDQELLRRYRATKDNEWLGILLQRYTLLLLGVSMKYLKDKSAAEDVVQQVFLKTLTHLPPEPVNNIKGWLYILTRNQCLQQLRTRKTSDTACLPENIADSEDMDDLQLRETALEHMEKALLQLNAEQRTSLELFYFEQLSYHQIEEKTGLSFRQVKSYIQNGKRNLKQILLKKLPGNDV